jgi:hypothetical protein
MSLFFYRTESWPWVSSLEEKPGEEGERLPALGHRPHQLSTMITVVRARLDPPESFIPDLFKTFLPRQVGQEKKHLESTNGKQTQVAHE